MSKRRIPRNARTYWQLIGLVRDNIATGKDKGWVLQLDVETVFIFYQPDENGPVEAKIEIPRTAFNQMIDWYCGFTGGRSWRNGPDIEL